MMSCNDCVYLDKNEKKWDSRHYSYQYRCIKNGYCCGWITNDNELKNMGCSYFETAGLDQISLF